MRMKMTIFRDWYVDLFTIALCFFLVVEGRSGSLRISKGNSLRYKNSVRENFRFPLKQDDGIIGLKTGRVQRLRRSGTRRYVTTRTMEPRIVKAMPENKAQQERSVTKTDEDTGSHYEESETHSVILSSPRRIYTSASHLASRPSYYRRSWLQKRRNYRCHTCSRCRASGLCGEATRGTYQAIAKEHLGCYETSTGTNYGQGDEFVRLKEDAQWNCVCEGGATHRISCRRIAQCRVDGIIRNIGEVWYTTSVFGYRMKCECYGDDNLAIWKCNTATSIQEIARESEYEYWTNALTCIDRSANGIIRQIGERWTKIGRYGTKENCVCEKERSSTVISCSTIISGVNDVEVPDLSSTSDKNSSEYENISESCFDNDTNAHYSVDSSWTKTVNGLTITCACITDENYKAVPTCEEKPQGCVITDNSIGRLSDFVLPQYTWNITAENGTAITCMCTEERGSFQIICEPLCTINGQHILLNSRLTLSNGQECQCTEEGSLLCDNITSAADLKGCHEKSCWPGVQCFASESGITCGPCPKDFTGDGSTCSRITCDDNPCFDRVKCLDNEDGGFTCGHCPVGFRGNGSHCIDVRVRCEIHRPCAENVICVDTAVGVECKSCPPGFSGDGYTCEKIIERCTPRSCAPDVVCTVTEEGVECGPCPSGFTGDGRTCVDIRERCADDPCAENVLCVDTRSGVQCGSCPPGFSGDGRQCVDVRIRCSSNPCHELVTCTDTAVTVVCGPCPIGFSGDGYSCIDIRIRCEDNPCHRGVSCTDTDIGVDCGNCPTGFEGDGFECVDFRVRCSHQPCAADVECTDTAVGVECGSCPEGLDGDGYFCIQRCGKRSCFKGVKCTDTEVGISCGNCPEGFVGDGFTCRDVRERCRDRPCFHGVKCTNTATGVTCGTCPEGFIGTGRNCVDVRIRCSSRPCFPKVRCKNTRTGFTCGPCPAGFSGDGVICERLQEICTPHSCFPGVVCTNTTTGVNCGPCPAGYEGDGKICVEWCSQNPCFDGVACENTEQGVECGPCPTGFSGNGRVCVDVKQTCDSTPCFEGVICRNTEIGAECDGCPDGFSGNGIICTEIVSQCDTPMCFVGVRCTSTESGIVCGPCPPGYSGDGFHCVETQLSCADRPCYPAVNCTDKENGVECGPCPEGYSGSGFHCEKIRVSCSNNPCHPAVSCHETDESVYCGKCPIGMSGDGYFCTFYPTCSDMTCPAGSVCHEINHKAICISCPPGFRASGHMCEDVRERCSDEPCFPGVWCENTEVGVSCGSCPPGHSGNGKVCIQTIKSCNDSMPPCFAGVECTDTERGALCGPCPPGFIGDGILCADLCHSKRNPCFRQVRCYHTRTGITCGRCPRGMLGDGYSCEMKRTCRDLPCYPGVECMTTDYEDVTCGDCPAGFKGDGFNCQDLRVWCEDGPCWKGVLCTDTNAGATCGPCPSGYTGDGITCNDIDECILDNPCSSITTCTNTLPGYSCGRCPPEYRESYIEDTSFANPRQVCEPINQCLVDNGGCVLHSECLLTVESSPQCGNCLLGYRGNQTLGCYPIVCQQCCEHARCTSLPGDLFICECEYGWAGDGVYCLPDSDFDAYPDSQLPCSSNVCSADNCINIANSGQEDSDEDGIGNYCDDDADNDGFVNVDDNCWLSWNPDQEDGDGDSHGDACDNCPSTPNYYQFDVDNDGIGDVCDDDIDGDGVINEMDICPKLATDSKDYDGDVVGDLCDNCPHTFNVNQLDTDQDGVGDICDTEMDSDSDGIQDDRDNCVFVVNPMQLDVDADGYGNACDEDDDGDGILDYVISEDFLVDVTNSDRYEGRRDLERWTNRPSNILDNCRLIYNPNQTDNNANGIGDECEDDFDGDSIVDVIDVCVENPKIQSPDFSKYTTVLLDPDGDAQMDPYWVVFNKGTELLQTVNSDPGIAVGRDVFQGVDYSGNVQVNTNADDDYLGVIFSYQSNSRFYALIWKQSEQSYWWPNPFRAHAQTGLQLKLIDSETGPGPALRNALWHTGNTDDEVQLLWHDKNGEGWKDYVPYHWHITHRPNLGYIRVRLEMGNATLSDSGKIIDRTLKGGKLGVFAFSQEHIIWSKLKYQCNDTIPWDYYVGSNEETSLLEKKKF